MKVVIIWSLKKRNSFHSSLLLKFFFIHRSTFNMSEGTVKWFNDQKGFGFISAEDGNDYFVHYTSIINEGKFKTLQEGAKVQFEVEEGPKGPRATQVTAI